MNITLHNNASAPEYFNLKFNIFLVSIEECKKNNPSFYCKYSAFLILCGYLCLLSVFPLMLNRMNKLGKRFRNQYNISFLWLCSIALMFSIDLLEFILNGDPNLYSMAIIATIIVCILFCFITIASYMRNYSIEGSAYRNGLTIFFSISIFIIVFLGRLWSKSRLQKFPNIDQQSPNSYHMLNTHFFLFYFVYVLFASVQVKIKQILI